jgi:hypothetical protein
MQFSSIVRRTVIAALLAAATGLTASAQPAPPYLQASVNPGQTVIAVWTPAPGATGYRVEAGLNPYQMLAGWELGPAITSFALQAPQGVYYLRVFARNALGISSPSNVVGISVSSTLAPPTPPTGFAASSAGTTVNVSLSLPAGPLTGLLLAAGSAPGQTQVVVPLPLAPNSTIGGVPAGTYFARVHAVGAGGPSGPSNEVAIVVAPAACLAPSLPAVSAAAVGSTVNVSWTPVAGAAGYVLAASGTPGGTPVVSVPVGAGTTSVSYPGVPAGTYYVRVTATNPCGATATSADAAVVVGAGTPPPPPPGGNRTPNPPSPTPPNYLRLPNREAVVMEMARLYPGELRNSCGNNAWLFRLVNRLRQEDTRWGLNWKRSRVGDMSQDAITYNYGPEADEGTRFVHVVDVIGGHCGSNPGAAWIDQTVLWSTGATWTLQPYLAAGYQP